MPNAVFPDGNWLLYRAYHSIGKRSAIPEKRVPLQILSWFYEYAMRWNATHGAISFDGPKVFRYDVYPEYKGERNNNKETSSNEVYACLEPTKRLFRLLGIQVFQQDAYEADDLVVSASTSWNAISSSNTSIIVGKDKDTFGYVTARTRVWTPPSSSLPEVLWTEKTVLDKYGISSKQFRELQILIGDKIDNVPNILPINKAKELLVKYGSLGRYFKTKEGVAFYKNNIAALRLNRILVTLKSDAEYP
jgi:DNA polymerase I